MTGKNIAIYSEAWGKGGIESFVLNVLPALCDGGFTITIYSTWEWADVDDSALKKLNVKRVSIFKGHKPGQFTRLWGGLKGFRQLLSNENFDAVWINTMNGFGFLYAREAKRAGVKSRIVHSHSSDVGEGAKILKRTASELGTLLWSKYSTMNVACSLPAGKYLFGNQKFQIVNNGIDIDRFKFSEESRNKIRLQLGLNNTDTLLGYIGRIVSSKNPLLQVQIFAEYKKLDPSSHYLMLGQGEAMEEAKAFARKLNVEDKIIFHEYVDNPAPFYSALDAFVMPSANEGLGLVRIEAQASGLPIVESDNLPKEGCVTDLVHFCSLDESSSVWARKVFSVLHADCYSAREFYYKQVSEAGFSNEYLNNSVIRLLTDATEIKCES